jgi:hypothetical protein
MIVTDWIHSIAGFFIILGLILGFDCTGNPLFIHHYFLFLPLFVGLNLFQFGFSKFCPLGIILKKIGVPETRKEGGESCCGGH